MSKDDLDFRAKKSVPEVTFYRAPDHEKERIGYREWVCSIRLPDGEYHGGEGTTQCEALIMASIHWAMHGETK